MLPIPGTSACPPHPPHPSSSILLIRKININININIIIPTNHHAQPLPCMFSCTSSNDPPSAININHLPPHSVVVWCAMVEWWHIMAWHDMAQYGMAWHGMARHGMAWHGMAWHGVGRGDEVWNWFVFEAVNKRRLQSSMWSCKGGEGRGETGERGEREGREGER